MSQHHCSHCFLFFGLHLRPFRMTYFYPYRRDHLPRRLNHPDIHAQPYCPHPRSMHPRSPSWHTICDSPYLPMRSFPKTWTRPLRLPQRIHLHLPRLLCSSRVPKLSSWMADAYQTPRHSRWTIYPIFPRSSTNCSSLFPRASP